MSKNSLGRSTGRRFNMAAAKRDLLKSMATKQKKSQTLYTKHLLDAKKPITLTF